MSIRRLYVIGNGFDLHHDINCSYGAFHEWLEANGLEVEALVEPTDSEIGKLIRKILQRSDATTDRVQKTLGLLFAADRMLIMDKLSDDKKVILSDRSFISSLAYQEPADWMVELNKYAKKPDLVLFLDLDVKTSVSRTSGEDEFENEEFLTQVKTNYLEIINDFNHVIIDANNGINKVSSDVKKAVASHVGLCKDCIL